MHLTANSPAPDFQAVDQKDHDIELKDFRGKYVLLYFYPKDDTPGCTTEACELRDNFVELEKYVIVLGVSSDTVSSHQHFAQKYQLPFPLLADPDKKLIKLYGADGVLFPKRVSFLINPEGNIAKIYEKVVPKNHALEVLNDVKIMQKAL